MPDEADVTYKFVCPKCGKVIEETDYSMLEARAQAHKCLSEEVRRLKEIVYISAPYTLGDVAINVKRVLDTADRLLEMGYVPFIPYLTHFWHIVSPKPWEVWLEIDLRFLPLCDKVLRLDGTSKGSDREVTEAKKLGMPIYYSIEELGQCQ